MRNVLKFLKFKAMLIMQVNFSKGGVTSQRVSHQPGCLVVFFFNKCPDLKLNQCNFFLSVFIGPAKARGRSTNPVVTIQILVLLMVSLIYFEATMLLNGKSLQVDLINKFHIFQKIYILLQDLLKIFSNVKGWIASVCILQSCGGFATNVASLSSYSTNFH